MCSLIVCWYGNPPDYLPNKVWTNQTAPCMLIIRLNRLFEKERRIIIRWFSHMECTEGAASPKYLGHEGDWREIIKKRMQEKIASWQALSEDRTLCIFFFYLFIATLYMIRTSSIITEVKCSQANILLYCNFVRCPCSYHQNETENCSFCMTWRHPMFERPKLALSKFLLYRGVFHCDLNIK